MKIKIFAMAVCFLLLCGCSYIEPDAQFTVAAVGFDKSAKTKTMYLQLTDGEKEEPFTVMGGGESFNSAFDDIKTELSKKASFGHCQIIILTEGVTEEAVLEALELCGELGISLRTSIVTVQKLQSITETENLPTGADIAGLLKNHVKSFGYGGHTAVFEIQTAISQREGKFALPVVELGDERVKINGLLEYQKSVPHKKLTVKESISYAKENNTYEGEKD